MVRKRIAITTIGCRSNQADSSALARLLTGYNLEIVGGFADSNVVVINTCCVTTQAERDCRKTIRRALSQSPDSRVIVIGCAVNAIADFGKDFDKRVEILSGIDANPDSLAEKIIETGDAYDETARSLGRLPGSLGRTRALVKIQNGCSHFCSYCIVPKARGPETSLLESEVFDEIDSLLKQGYREIVITGVQLGAWGVDLPGKPSLANLMDKIAKNVTPGRVRLSSIEPWAVDKNLVETVAANDSICSHLHLPLQSGDDGILKAMRRGYTSGQYLQTVEQIKKAIPDIALGTDVIFGFPGEDEAAFSNTMQTLQTMEPSYIHAFTYSPRPQTRAAKMPGRPLKALAKERTGKARQAGAQFSHNFRDKQSGTVREVLVEENRNDSLHGLTDTFIPVEIDADLAKPGELIQCRLGSSVEGQNRIPAEPV